MLLRVPKVGGVRETNAASTLALAMARDYVSTAPAPKSGDGAKRRILLNRDCIIRAQVGNVRVSALRATNTLARAQDKWQMSSSATAVFGEAMAATSMYCSFLKGEERTTLEISGKGGLGNVYVEAISLGEVRGSVQNPHYEGDVSEALGAGSFRLSKVLYGAHKPFVTTVESRGNVRDAWQRFFDKSEQVPSVVFPVVRMDPSSSKPLFCGGFLAQALPSSSSSVELSDKEREALEAAGLSAEALDYVTGEQQVQAIRKKLGLDESKGVMQSAEMMEQLMTNDGVLAYLSTLLDADFGLGDNPLAEIASLLPSSSSSSSAARVSSDGRLMDPTGQASKIYAFSRTPLDYICRCVREEKLAQMLVRHFPPTELGEMFVEAAQKGQQGVEIKCQYCNSASIINAQQVEKALSELDAEKAQSQATDSTNLDPLGPPNQ